MAEPEPDWRAAAAAGVAALQRWYSPRTGLWRTAGWWNAANALTAVIGYTRATGDRSYAGVIETTFSRAPRTYPEFVNTYYDDNGWWGLAWVAAYDLTGDARYLDAAKVIFDRTTRGWDDTFGGGVWWSQARKYKNAIPNELFLTLAARLHQREPKAGYYRSWAERTWRWFSASGMIGESGLVNDGLTADGRNNGDTTWTYNQGVILGGLAALHEITGDRAYLDRGQSIADAALGALAGPPGILTEPHEAATGRRDRDRPQFKGIFVRHLHDFGRVSGRPEYGAFILGNARSICASNRNAAGQFGLRWAGPFDRADAARQSSAVDVLNAAVALTAS
ncbi:MAG TPA: glycoside hydrolase family 76 protein [Streptosporangiaceae bacterium]|jgi:predicted alpha-1,6-mannanase (GH76 family)